MGIFPSEYVNVLAVHSKFTFYFRLSFLYLLSTLYFGMYLSTPSLSHYSVFLPGSFLSLLNQCPWFDIEIRFRNPFCLLFYIFSAISIRFRIYIPIFV